MDQFELLIQGDVWYKKQLALLFAVNVLNMSMHLKQQNQLQSALLS